MLHGFSGRQVRRRRRREAMYEVKQAVNKSAEVRRRAPIEHDPEVLS